MAVAENQMRSVKGLEAADLPTGTRFLKLHHFADPEKGDAWLEMMRVKMADTPEDFRREILMDDTVFGGQPVYPTYQDEVHCPPVSKWLELSKGATNRIPIIPASLYWAGVDCGQTLSPAALLIQITPHPFQVHFLQEVVSSGGESMEEFAPRALNVFMNRIPGNWDEIQWWADSTVNTRSGSNKISARHVAMKHGLNMRPVSNAWAPRLAAMNWLFTRWIDEKTPGCYIDAVGCPTFRLACKGAYQYETSASGDQGGPGAIILAPKKNSYSHIADAGQYVALKVRQMIEGGGARLQE